MDVLPKSESFLFFFFFQNEVFHLKCVDVGHGEEMISYGTYLSVWALGHLLLCLLHRCCDQVVGRRTRNL